MNITIVIPNYNGEKVLKENFPKLIDAISVSINKVEIIIVDDGSKDNSLLIIESLKSEFSSLKLIQNKKNMGFSSTVNKGVEEAKGEIIILLNTDAYPEKGFLEPILKDFKDDEVFAVGFMDKSFENGKIVLRGRGIGKWQRGFLMHQRGEVNKDNTLWASGGSSAFRKSVWIKFGGLNTIYNPFYWEDIDISYRALKSGYKILFDKRVVVYHNHSKGAIKQSYSPFEIKRISYRNQFIFVWENATDLYLQFKHIFYLPYHLIKALMRRDWAFWLGFIDAFVLLPKIIKSSFNNQNKFKKTDKEVIKDFEI